MGKFAFAVVGIAVLHVGASSPVQAQEQSARLSPEAATAMVEDYCLMCHNDAAMTGGLTLESFDTSHPELNAETAEKTIRKLRTRMMPPSYASRPDDAAVEALITMLAAHLDARYLDNPDPGRRTFQRLNRAEYQRSVKDLLAIDVDIDALLPTDTVSHSFDNIADVQGMSPTVLDSYLRAAERISREAVGDPKATPSETSYKVPRTGSQLRHVEGAPFGTRGGVSVIHNFPADGDYIFKIEPHTSPQGFLYGKTAKNEQVEVSMNGKRLALLDIDPLMNEEEDGGLILETEPIAVKAGPHRISAAFLKTSEGPIDDVIGPIEHTLADSHIGIAYGITTLPHLRDFTISGPYDVTGVSDTPSRRRIFTCRPVTAEEEQSCATQIVTALASRAYRRPVDELGLEGLMSFYARGRDNGDFESGVRMALQAILASPSFVFRFEELPETVALGERYQVSDLDLASRLSFFLWATAPDEELVRFAARGQLSDPAILEQQVRRMIADPRSEALSTRFASQWLRLQDLAKLNPDALRYPLYDARLAVAMKRETELFFDNLVREDRPVLELLTADYTFVNERLAAHYQIPNVTGAAFRRVTLGGDGDGDDINENRRGVFGHGSILALTSVANRTSPVQRGKWVMEVLLGSPPPPPPNVPALEETSAVAEDRVLSIRERMEMHRKNPACSSCHTVIDPIGLALENFDVTGAWRLKDESVPIDASGELYDGSRIDGPLGLRDAILNRSDAFVATFTESLLTYALGRRVEHYDMPVVRMIAREAAANEYRMLSYDKIRLGFEQMLGFPVARSTLCRAMQRLARRAKPTRDALVEALRASPVVYADETGWKQGGRRVWLWVFTNLRATVYEILPGRGFEQAASVLGKNYAGTLGVDGWAPYRCFKEATLQTCYNHLLHRCHELLETATRGAVRFPRLVKAILRHALALRDRRDAGEISPHGLRVAKGLLQAKMNRLLHGRFTNPANQRFAKHLRRYRDNLFVFLDRADVEATNYPAEQDIRIAVVNRKTCGGSNRTAKGAQAQSILMSVLQSCRHKGIRVIDIVTSILRAPDNTPVPLVNPER